MKIPILNILLIIGGLLLIGSKAIAQNGGLSKYSDPDWIDSLAIKYRVDYIESAMLQDEAILNSYYSAVSALILTERNGGWFERSQNDKLDLAIRDYVYQGLVQKLRRRTFEKEIRSARREFSFTADQ
jgi:hypothetical protein